jgi:nicotinamidase-related amidase
LTNDPSLGHRPDLSTLSSREKYRSYNNSTGLGIGSQGPLGRLLIRGEAGHDIVDELYPLPNEPIIDKPGRGAFAHTDFDLLLRNKGIKNLVIAGVTTDVCVSTTMREANDRAYDCLLVEDGAATSEPHLHYSTCESVKMEGGIFGVTGKLDNVIDALEAFKNANPKTGTSIKTTQTRADTPATPGAMPVPPMTTPMSAGLGLSMSSISSSALNPQFVTNTPGMNSGQPMMIGS